MFDYETYKLIWWGLIGILLIGFAIMDGHDMGVGTLLPWVARSDVERRVVINTVGPHWDGNQVWFVTGGGAIFAAWPMIYATAFSGFYWAMLAALWALFLRPVGFDFRSKINDPRWRSSWDWGLFVGSVVPPIIFGVAFGNLLLGVPFTFDEMLVSTYSGSFWALLNPFALLCGVVSSAMVTMHGGIYLAHRSEGQIAARARRAATVSGLLLLLAFTAAGFWVATLDGYVISSSVDPNAVPDPMGKTVIREAGAWLGNYRSEPLTLLVPLLAYMGVIMALWLLRVRRSGWAFVSSALALAAVVATAGVSMFPFLLPSSSDPRASLTVWDSTSSHLTLGIMFWVSLILVPLIVLYTSWAYRVMRGKVTAEQIQRNSHSAY
ncbi:cytochrome d ubiquinol oxidase subunit II [Sinimarinibacterium sp. NLF-5-8]|uniref:cytochrome d ubiquinol oxidase subunit II n=1 Tax=Sinimarinibacterium sp. NLF-5-8 TaxID=2698684 RepID=UPI00137BC1FB|nr:cytochrome d ubiquinol oxidase subunit II [Sinimarinibacterium sp. NLF-5-8]QHS11224.1 cytochrome d ubiquinol oxidase subunit II [Sinimarinibacterium sp. NLF-5-8]